MIWNTERDEAILALTRRIEALEETVTELCSHAGINPPQNRVGEPSAHVRELLARGKKIAAVKALREETGLGLKEAKDIVDRL